ncbi:MAG: hypothetical protein HXS48_15120 [Theionarchaea archaeon]|nr:hypothetical protein [Theionarchaea archaeon]
MDRKKVSLAVISVAVAFLALTAVTASSWTLNTPLYIFRMQQQSSRMNFLPYEKNGFTYTAEKGYNLSCDAVGCCGAEPLEPPTNWETCSSCESTCWSTCPATCPATCPNTCVDTCPDTCEPTCWSTCEEPTCWNTCGAACPTSPVKCPTYRDCP